MAKLKSDELQQTVNFRISEEELERLDRLAIKGGLTRSQFIRNLVVVGLAETEAWEKIGMVRAVLTVRDVIDWMKDKAEKFAEEEDLKKGKV